MNLIKQYPYYKELKVGDVFRLLFPQKRYVFGRIMKLNTAFGGFEQGCIKLHIYDHVSGDERIPDGLCEKTLLVPPLFVNRLGFSRGYLPVVGNLPLELNANDDRACYRDDFSHTLRDE